MSVESFLQMLKEAVRECGETAMAAALEQGGVQCYVFRHGHGPLSSANVASALDRRLRLKPGFKPDFQTPTDLLDPSRNVVQFCTAIHAVARVQPNNVRPLHLA